MAANWPAIRAGIFAGESGGDYDALFGFSNRPGGRFGNTKLTDMTVDQALAFSDPRGPYGQWVKEKIGKVATPMGAYQVVGTTLRHAKNGLGLTGNERMTTETQDKIGQWILANQGTDAWEGYRGPGDPSKYTTPASLPGKIGGDGMVARNFDPQVAAQTNTPSIFGSIAPSTPSAPPGIPSEVASYATSDEREKSPLKRLAEALQKIPDAPQARSSMPDPSATNGDALLKYLSNPRIITDFLLKKRLQG